MSTKFFTNCNVVDVVNEKVFAGSVVVEDSQITGGRPRQSSMGAPRMSSAANIPMHIQRIIRYASFSLLTRLSSLSRETIWSSWTINISTQQAHCAP